MQWCVYTFLLQEYFKILLSIISNSRILSTQTQGDKLLINVNTGIFLKIENYAVGHIICRLVLYSDWYSRWTHVTQQVLW